MPLSPTVQEATPRLELDGFSGPLEALLTLARARRIDLARISLPALVDQLAAAMARRPAALGEKAVWLVMAADLALLRSRLLLPPEAGERGAAEVSAERLRGALLAAEQTRALAAWLARRPQLGHDVFARGRPEFVGIMTTPEHEVDVVEFLWAALELFEDGAAADTAPPYRPPALDLYTVQDARERIRRLLAQNPEGRPLGRFLPPEETATAEGAPPSRGPLRRCSAWSSTFAASLEMAKQGELKLAQESGFAPIHVGPVPAEGASGVGEPGSGPAASIPVEAPFPSAFTPP